MLDKTTIQAKLKLKNFLNFDNFGWQNSVRFSETIASFKYPLCNKRNFKRARTTEVHFSDV